MTGEHQAKLTWPFQSRRSLSILCIKGLAEISFFLIYLGKEPITYAGSVISVTLAAAYITIISLYTASLTVDQVQIESDLDGISLNDDVVSTRLFYKNKVYKNIRLRGQKF